VIWQSSGGVACGPAKNPLKLIQGVANAVLGPRQH
jgi:hypothetical protein